MMSDNRAKFFSSTMYTLDKKKGLCNSFFNILNKDCKNMYSLRINRDFSINLMVFRQNLNSFCCI